VASPSFSKAATPWRQNLDKFKTRAGSPIVSDMKALSFLLDEEQTEVSKSARISASIPTEASSGVVHH
jgi:hypothetical protein